MNTTALSCGNTAHAGRAGGDSAQWAQVPPGPGRKDVDPLLPEGPGRVVVRGTDADLAAVVLRLLRKQRIADLTVGYVPVAESAASRLYGLPVGAAAEEIAFRAAGRPVPLVRDDSGGLIVASGEVAPITGQVYCDEHRLLNGPATGLHIAPDLRADPLPEPTADPMSGEIDPAEDGLLATTTRRGLFRRRRDTARGRAVQASFRSATVLRDGVAHPRPVTTWVWYRHTEDLLLALP